jgi:hypothetical protein
MTGGLKPAPLLAVLRFHANGMLSGRSRPSGYLQHQNIGGYLCVALSYLPSWLLACLVCP